MAGEGAQAVVEVTRLVNPEGVKRVRSLDLDAATYQKHSLHAAPDLDWVEKNCYVDIWIELLHAAGLEPIAMGPFALAVDFEGD